MRHRVAHRKLGRITPHRIALLRNLATALFERERIRTTLMKAKELRPFAERLITLAKRGEGRLHARRLVARDIKNPVVVKKLFDEIGARFVQRPGGYTRILRLGTRRGDGAEVAIVELIGSEYKPAKKEDKKAAASKKEAAPKAAAEPQDPGVAAGPAREAGAQVVEQLLQDRSALDLALGQPPRVDAVVLAARQRDQALGERPQLLGLHQGGADALALEQRRGEVAQQRDPVGCGAPELAVSDSMSHGLSV